MKRWHLNLNNDSVARICRECVRYGEDQVQPMSVWNEHGVLRATEGDVPGILAITDLF